MTMERFIVPQIIFENGINKIVQGDTIKWSEDEYKRQYNLSAINSFITMEHPNWEVS